LLRKLSTEADSVFTSPQDPRITMNPPSRVTALLVAAAVAAPRAFDLFTGARPGLPASIERASSFIALAALCACAAVAFMPRALPVRVRARTRQ
jgi:branched-subunit amino acid transport protein